MPQRGDGVFGLATGKWWPDHFGRLDDVALQRHLEHEAGGEHRQERPHPGGIGIEHEAVAQIVVGHRHRAAVGNATHHALAPLAVIALAPPGSGGFVGQKVVLRRTLAGQQGPIRLGQGGNGIVLGANDDRRIGWELRRTAPPHRRSWVGKLVVQVAERIPVFRADLADHQQHAGMTGARRAHQSRSQEQIFDIGRRGLSERRIDRHRRRRGQPPQRRYCHRKIPSRQP